MLYVEAGQKDTALSQTSFSFPFAFPEPLQEDSCTFASADKKKLSVIHMDM